MEEQKSMLRKGGKYHPELDIPIFPLNTDGIDPAGINILIENVTIENFDDAVAVKPCTQAWKYCTCAGNILVRNSRVIYGILTAKN